MVGCCPLSDLRVAEIADLAGTGPTALFKQTAPKAWLNFNGTSTVSIRDSLNVSSITDRASGQYTVAFTNDFEDANYAPFGTSTYTYSATNFSRTTNFGINSAPTAGSIYITSSSTAAVQDCELTTGTFLGDLA